MAWRQKKPQERLHAGSLTLLRDRCTPDTSHVRLPLPVLLPLLPLLLVLLLCAASLLAATLVALRLLEAVFEFIDPTPPDPLRDNAQHISIPRVPSTKNRPRLTRSGSFCCGWLWAEGTLTPAKPTYWRRVQRCIRAPRRRLHLLLSETRLAAALVRVLQGRSPPPQRRSSSRERGYFFVLVRAAPHQPRRADLPRPLTPP